MNATIPWRVFVAAVFAAGVSSGSICGQEAIHVPAGRENLLAALERAPEGAHLRLAAGSYEGPVVLDKKLRLSGVRGGRVRIWTDGTVPAVVIRAGVEAVFEDLAVEHVADGSQEGGGDAPPPRAAGVLVEGGASLAFRRGRVQGAGGHGIHGSPEASLDLREVEIFSSGGIGVLVEGGPSRLARIKAHLNAGGGLHVTGGEASVVDSHFHGNGREGIYIRNAGTRTKLDRVRCEKNGLAGILAADGCIVEAVAPECVDNQNEGFDAGGGGTQAAIQGGVFRGNRAGVSVRAGASLEFSSGLCESNRTFGLVGNGEGAKLVARKVQSLKNAKAGAIVNVGASGTIVECILTENSESGLYCDGEGSEVLVEKSTAERNGKHGISIARQGTGRIIGNRLADNGQIGIVIEREKTVAIVERNECIGNKGDGLSFWMGGQGEARENLLEGNGGAGIAFSGEGSGATLERNRSIKNLFGISFSEGARVFDIPKSNQLRSNQKGTVRRN